MAVSSAEVRHASMIARGMLAHRTGDVGADRRAQVLDSADEHYHGKYSAADEYAVGYHENNVALEWPRDNQDPPVDPNFEASSQLNCFTSYFHQLRQLELEGRWQQPEARSARGHGGVQAASIVGCSLADSDQP